LVSKKRGGVHCRTEYELLAARKARPGGSSCNKKRWGGKSREQQSDGEDHNCHSVGLIVQEGEKGRKWVVSKRDWSIILKKDNSIEI